MVANHSFYFYRERWCYHLKPGIIKGNWTTEEDELIKKMHAKYGNSWNKIAAHIEGRSQNSIKNRWNSWLRSSKVEDTEMEHSISSEDEQASLSLLQLRESPLTLPLPESVAVTVTQVKPQSDKKRKVSDDKATKENIQPEKRKRKKTSSKLSLVSEANRTKEQVSLKHTCVYD
jgi:hypothetical protein